MKRIALLLTAAIVGHTAFAQVSVDPEVGFNNSIMRTKVGNMDARNSDSKNGLHVGVGVNFNLSNGFYFKPGLYYNELGGELNIIGIKSTTTLRYLSVPLNLGYNMPISDNIGSIFVEAGPQVAYAVNGQTKVKGLFGGENTSDLNFGSKNNETNPFDWGFNFGLGYTTPWGVYLKGSYGLGMGNLSNVTDTKITNNSWNVSLGYKVKL